MQANKEKYKAFRTKTRTKREVELPATGPSISGTTPSFKAFTYDKYLLLVEAEEPIATDVSCA